MTEEEFYGRPIDKVEQDYYLAMRNAVNAVTTELLRAKKKFPAPFVNMHEGASVLREEFEEMWDEVKANNTELALKEAVQVAAMAIRFMVELKNGNSEGH